MKQLLAIILMGFSTSLFSQEKVSFLTPPPSPEASFTQQLVNGEITVTYSRPLARGRKIFGGLVPFIATLITTLPGTNVLSGLWYPIGVALLCFIIGSLYLSNKIHSKHE